MNLAKETLIFSSAYFELFAILNRNFQNFNSLDQNSTRYFELLKIEKNTMTIKFLEKDKKEKHIYISHFKKKMYCNVKKNMLQINTC